MIAANLVTDATNGADQGTSGTGVNLAAQIIDIDVDDIGDGVGMHAPDLLNDRGAGNGAAGIAQQEIEQRVFLGA